MLNKTDKKNTKLKLKPKLKPKQSRKHQQQAERQELYEAQQRYMIRRFPTRLSDREEIDRLRVCVAQCLAVMDRFLEFWELRQCPFQDLPDKHQQQQPATTTAAHQQQVDSIADATATKHDKGNYHPYL